MSGFFDLFGLKRRQEVRVRVNWLVDAKLAEAERYVGFHARDISLSGVRLLANAPEDFDRVISAEREVALLLRVPGSTEAFEVEAEVKWVEANGKAVMGCQFTRLGREARRALEAYIEAHPQDLLKEE